MHQALIQKAMDSNYEEWHGAIPTVAMVGDYLGIEMESLTIFGTPEFLAEYFDQCGVACAHQDLFGHILLDYIRGIMPALPWHEWGQGVSIITSGNEGSFCIATVNPTGNVALLRGTPDILSQFLLGFSAGLYPSLVGSECSNPV